MKSKADIETLAKLKHQNEIESSKWPETRQTPTNNSTYSTNNMSSTPPPLPSRMTSDYYERPGRMCLRLRSLQLSETTNIMIAHLTMGCYRTIRLEDTLIIIIIIEMVSPIILTTTINTE